MTKLGVYCLPNWHHSIPVVLDYLCSLSFTFTQAFGTDMTSINMTVGNMLQMYWKSFLGTLFYVRFF